MAGATPKKEHVRCKILCTGSGLGENPLLVPTASTGDNTMASVEEIRFPLATCAIVSVCCVALFAVCCDFAASTNPWAESNSRAVAITVDELPGEVPDTGRAATD